jgi:hypothetical protein
MSDPVDRLRAEVALLRNEVGRSRLEARELRSIVDRLTRRDAPDGRIGSLLAQIYDFAESVEWTAGEMLEMARRGAPNLSALLAGICAGGSRGDEAIRFGRWLERHAPAEADGLRLERIRRDNGSWLYAITPTGENSPTPMATRGAGADHARRLTTQGEKICTASARATRNTTSG